MPLFRRLLTAGYLFSTCFMSTVDAQDSTVVAQSVYKAMLNLDLNGIDSGVDTNSRLYFKALAYALHGQYPLAQPLLTEIALNSSSPVHEAAREYLFKSFIANGQYSAYCEVADRLHIKPPFYEDATFFKSLPPSTLNFLMDIKAVPFSLQKKSYVIVTAQLNGKKAHLLLDTGATFTVITEKLARQAGLSMQLSGTGIETSTNSPVTGSNALVTRLTFGNINVQNLPVKCFPTMVKGLSIDGIIGLDVLRQLTYTLDFKSKLCTFKKPVSRQMDSSANLFRERVALIRVTTTANQPLYLIYDSGSNTTNLTQSATDKVNGYPSKKSTTRSRGLNGTRLTERTRTIKQFSFSVAGHTVVAERATFTNQQKWLYNIPVDGITGNKPFHTGTLTIDFPNGQFIYTP